MRHIVKISLLLLSGSLLCSGFVLGDEKKQVGILWIGQSGMTKRVCKGFTERMKEVAPEIALDFKPELSEEEAERVYSQFLETKDAVVFLRSNGAQYMGAHPPKIPGFVGGCSNPVELGAMTDMKNPDKKITGVTYFLSAKQQLEMFKGCFPYLRTVGLLVEKGHPSTVIDMEETTRASKELGLVCRVAECATKVDVLKNTKMFSDTVDLIIIGNQALVFDHSKEILGLSGRTPVVSYSEKPIKMHGALCGVVPDDDKLGRLLADSVVLVVRDEMPVNRVPVKTDPDPKFLLSMPVYKKLGVSLPEDIMSKAEKIE